MLPADARHLHHKWAKLALLNGKHVFVEKPSTTSLEDTMDLISVASEKGLALHENYMFVYGMICFAFDMGLITYEERQYLSEIARSKANEIREQEKAQAQKAKEEKARIIAEYEAARGKQKK